MKEPLRTQLIEWHKAHENDVFDFAIEIHEYCKEDVQLLKSGCIKLRNAFITDTGIGPFQSCTIAGAYMNVLRTSHMKPNSIRRVLVNGYRSLRNCSHKSMEWITYCEKIAGVSYRHAWSVGGEMNLKKAKVWADAYFMSPRHEYVMTFMGFHFHGCQTCFDLSTMNTHLNKYMGDLYRKTMRLIARVTNSGYMISVMWECEWDNLVKEKSEIKEHVESYSLSSPLTPREALYGSICKTCSLHASCTDTLVIKYVDVQSWYTLLCL